MNYHAFILLAALALSLPANGEIESRAVFLERSRAEQYREVTWQPLSRWTFDADNSLGDVRPVNGDWKTVDGHLRLRVDGAVILDAWDRRDPIDVDAASWIGVGTYETPLCIDTITLYREKETP